MTNTFASNGVLSYYVKSESAQRRLALVDHGARTGQCFRAELRHPSTEHDAPILRS